MKPHYPYHPTDTGMPASFTTLHCLLGGLRAVLRHGPFCARRFASSPEEIDAAGWLEAHGFLKVVNGRVHCTGSGATYLDQVSIALDSLSRQFRPRLSPAPANAHLN